MSEHHANYDGDKDNPETLAEDMGRLTVEDDPGGTTNPADLAGTAGPEDDAAGPDETHGVSEGSA